MRSRPPSPATRPNSSRSPDRLGQYSQASVFTASGAEVVVLVSRSKNRMDEERLVKLWYTRVVPSMAPVMRPFARRSP